MQRKGRDDDTYGTDYGGVFLLRGVSPDVSSLVLTNSILRENFAVDDSGVIDNIDASITATDCIFENNEAKRYGGAIYSEGVITLERCRFDGNAADDLGGALIIVENSRATITECEFLDNISYDASGGAIFVADFTSMVLERCIFTRNEAHNFGGAIYTATKGSCEILECSFEENEADLGGAIANILSSTEIVGTTFECNEAYEIGGAIVSANEIEDDGEIFSFGEIEISDSEFTSNKANEGAGAIAYIGGPAFINGTVFQNNKSLNSSQLSDDIWDANNAGDIQCGTGSGNCFCNASNDTSVDMNITTNVLPTTCSGADKGPDCPGCHQSAPASCSEMTWADAMTRSGTDQDAVDVSSFVKGTDGTPAHVMSETILKAQEKMDEMRAKYMAKKGGH